MLNPNYEVVVGLEVHAELNTESKIYCSCKNAFGLEVNSQCCPICMGMPGTLPTLNMQVVEYAIKMGPPCTATSTASASRTGRTISTPTCPNPIRSASLTFPSARPDTWTCWWKIRISPPTRSGLG